MTEQVRCSWPGTNELMVRYHDTEWGVACHDDRKLFEYMVLDAFQAGLSWAIVLNKREGFRRAFDNFDPAKIARYDEAKIQTLLQDTGIIRNQLKVRGTVTNAQRFLEVKKEFNGFDKLTAGSFDKYIWGFVGGKPIVNQHQQDSDIGATSPESDAMSLDMKKRGFKFCGTTICYAFMQAAGLVNDHVVGCFRHTELKNLT